MRKRPSNILRMLKLLKKRVHTPSSIASDCVGVTWGSCRMDEHNTAQPRLRSYMAYFLVHSRATCRKTIQSRGMQYSDRANTPTVENSLGLTAVVGNIPHLLVFGLVCLVQVCNLWHERVVGVRVAQQAADGQKHFADCQGRRPCRKGMHGMASHSCARVTTRARAHIGLSRCPSRCLRKRVW